MNLKQPSATFFLAAGLLAGCAGGNAPQSSANALPVLSQAGVSNNVIADKSSKCMSKNGVSVHPCSVKLTITNPTANVTAKGPAKGTFTVEDRKCVANNVATVEGSGNTYVVTAGTSNGTCTARFDDKMQNGHRIGSAKLSITNHIS